MITVQYNDRIPHSALLLTSVQVMYFLAGFASPWKGLVPLSPCGLLAATGTFALLPLFTPWPDTTGTEPEVPVGPAMPAIELELELALPVAQSFGVGPSEQVVCFSPFWTAVI